MSKFALIAGFPVFLFGLVALVLGAVLAAAPEVLGEPDNASLRALLLVPLGISCLVASAKTLLTPRWLLVAALCITVAASIAYPIASREWLALRPLETSLLLAVPVLASWLLARRLWRGPAAQQVASADQPSTRRNRLV